MLTASLKSASTSTLLTALSSKVWSRNSCYSATRLMSAATPMEQGKTVGARTLTLSVPTLSARKGWTRRILSVKRVTEPVQRLVQDLDSDNVLENSKKDDCKKILALFYFGRNGMSLVLNELNCSKSVFYDRRNFLVYSAIQYLGL